MKDNRPQYIQSGQFSWRPFHSTLSTKHFWAYLTVELPKVRKFWDYITYILHKSHILATFVLILYCIQHLALLFETLRLHSFDSKSIRFLPFTISTYIQKFEGCVLEGQRQPWLKEIVFAKNVFYFYFWVIFSKLILFYYSFFREARLIPVRDGK